MIKCSYCGWENHDAVTACHECGTELPPPPLPETKETSPGNGFKPEHVDFSALGEVISTNEGFPYPNWKIINAYIQQNVPENHWEHAYREAVIQWLEKLRTFQQPAYFLDESENFFLVSNQPKEERQNVLRFAEKQRGYFSRQFQGVKFQKTCGKQVLLFFEQMDDYYRYISHFYPPGAYPRSGGVFLKGGYGHIALPRSNHHQPWQILAHELTHNALFTLPIPRWLNEGIAVTVDSQFAKSRRNGLDAEMDLAERHRTYWTPENIQGFWSGKAFNDPDSSELAYSLARIAMHLITSERGNFKAFLQAAHYGDGGEAAFQSAYKKSLGQIVGIFLGKGDWSPKPEIIRVQLELKQPSDD